MLVYTLSWSQPELHSEAVEQFLTSLFDPALVQAKRQNEIAIVPFEGV